MTATTVTTPAADDQEVLWHNLPSDEVCRALDVDPAVGLTATEVTERRARYGSNKLAEEATEPAWKAFLRQYQRPDAARARRRRRRQHRRHPGRRHGPRRARTHRAQRGDGPAPGRQGRRERRRAPPDADHDGAACRRDGQLVEIPAEELVPGDIVGFEAGDKVPGRRSDPGRRHPRDRGGRRSPARAHRSSRSSTRWPATRSRSATASTWRT